jgi:1,4-dihydroxy-2-naphthoate octaprenyltransferase
MGRLHAILVMTRPSQMALIVVILANGFLLGAWRLPTTTDGAAALVLAVATVLTILASAAVHLANESADHETDRLTRRTAFSGGSGALEASGLSSRVPLLVGLSLAAIVTIVTLLASASGAFSGAAAALLLAGLAGGLAYSLPPIAAMRRGWGEPLNALLGALLLPLFGVAVVVGSVGSSDVVAFLPFFLVVMASVMATAWPDRDADAATGKLTMQVRLGPRTLRLIHAAASATFVVATLISAAVGAMPLALAGLLVLPALVVGAARYTRVTSPLANVAAMVSLVAITTVALIIELNASGRLG